MKNLIKRLLSKKSRGIISANFTTLGFLAFVGLGTVMGVYAVGHFGDMQHKNKITLAAEEFGTMMEIVESYSINGTDNGSGYAGANAEAVAPYANVTFNLNNSGATSYFDSNTSFGTKIIYYISSGTNDNSYTIYVDASAASTNWEDADKIKYKDLIIKKVAGKHNKTLADTRTGNITDTATAISAASTTPAVAYTSGADADMKFELTSLGL